MKSVLSTLLALLTLTSLLAQEGIVRGMITDKGTDEPLPGVHVTAEGIDRGTLTDLDGKFSLSLPPGIYTLQFSFVSYETLKVQQVEVRSNAVTSLGQLRLAEALTEIHEVTVSSQSIRNTENALLVVKKKSANLIDGIAAAAFSKTGDSDAASAIKRVSGVTVSSGKYVFVRGLGDRYTKTLLNHMEVPGLDPDRNTIQMDIFPTGIIDNIIIHKSFTANLPADFTGGIVDLATKDFPDVRTGSIALSFGYNPAFHFNKNYLTYRGGKTDFLGFDDGTRKIPATNDIPFFTEAITQADGPKAQRYREILESFNPVLAARRKTSLMNFSLALDAGNQKSFKKFTGGYNLVFTYKNETEFYRNVTYGRYGLAADSSITEMQMREYQTGDLGVHSVLWSALGGVALKTKTSKIRLTLLHLQSGESKAGIFNYENSDQGAEFSAFQHNLEYSQRAITHILLYGKHYWTRKWELEWNVSPTYSGMSDPDIRFTRYREDNGVLSIGTEAGFPQRIWRDLKEWNFVASADITGPVKFQRLTTVFRMGGAYVFKTRDYVLRSFNINVRNIPLTGDPDELFASHNLWPAQGDLTNGTTYEAVFLPSNPNQFKANLSNVAAYVSAELSLLSSLKAIIGLRAEYFSQRYTGYDQLKQHVLNNDKLLDEVDFFPSVNLVYAIHNKHNLRAAFSQTIARPSFKELSYAEIYDPITGRTFIGGLFRDANDVKGVVYWEGNLSSTRIQNYDLRWEFFPDTGMLISLGVFYKKFNNPIEMVQFVQQAAAYQPRNVNDAHVYGGEAELKHSLKFISPQLSSLEVTANFSIIGSRIQLSKTELDSRVENARAGEEVKPYRPMAGQSPYAINCGLVYTGAKKGFLRNFEAGLYYYVQGHTLYYVGIADRPDVYSKPFHSLNMSLSKSFGENSRFALSIKAQNILNSRMEYVFRSYGSSDKHFSLLSPGYTFQLKLAYRFF
ncbi:MAG: outer membrane protein [Chitinophagales bacterium]|nr:MAG: outer membrane protein [Chitinophagales bacterium]